MKDLPFYKKEVLKHGYTYPFKRSQEEALKIHHGSPVTLKD